MSGLTTLLDMDYDPQRLRDLLEAGADPTKPDDETGEPPLLTATRRRRLDAVRILLDAGADLEGRDAFGKTAWVHAARRGFTEVADVLEAAGASTHTTSSDRLAIALSAGDLAEARRILATHPDCAHTGNREEDRLLADMAGREATEPVVLLIEAGADLTTPGLDGGTPLHQAAWFGQPANARILLDAGAPLDVFDPVHDSSPLHWAVHGSRFSGGAAERQPAYVELTRMLLDAGSRTTYPPEWAAAASRPYVTRMLEDASPAVATVLREAGLGP